MKQVEKCQVSLVSYVNIHILNREFSIYVCMIFTTLRTQHCYLTQKLVHAPKTRSKVGIYLTQHQNKAANVKK